MQGQGIKTNAFLPDINIETYHAGPGISKSQLDQVAKSPAHWKASLEIERKETPALRVGRLFHNVVLEPESIDLAVAPKVDRRTKVGKATWEAFVSASKDSQVVTEDEYTLIMGMRDSVMLHPIAKALFELDGMFEHSVYWQNEESGLLCKCRPDWWLPGKQVIVDLKTTEDARPWAFARDSAKYRYHVQNAFYDEGVGSVALSQGFIFVVVEKAPPYAVAVYQLDDQAILAGQIMYQEELNILADCQRTGIYPAYSDRIEVLSLPKYTIQEAFDHV